MSFQAVGPGKTAPKLAHDFKLFDPLRADARQLKDHAILATDFPFVKPHGSSCRHEYTTKHFQSTLPPDDLRSRDAEEPYKAALICRKCRIHADVVLDLTGCLDPCPNSDNPLHHFQRTSSDDVERHELLRYGWKCSAPACGARLWVDFTTPKLEAGDVDLLTNTDVLHQRFKSVQAADPERDGLKQATPMDVLSRLRRYMKDAQKPEHERRTFPANNKRFMEAFGLYGADCRHILQAIGFKYALNDEGDRTWTLPNPGEDGGVLDRLEDYDSELRALMHREAATSNIPNPAADVGWPSADRDIDRTLGAQGYSRHPSLRRTAGSAEDQACFAGLGALSDFADSLIVFAFERQVMVDPTGQPVYLGHLQEIAQSRNSEDLQMKVVTLESMGYISRRELDEAYRELSVVQSDSDDRILNLFQAALPDLSPDRQTHLRSVLGKIASHRDSQLLKNAANQNIETYDEALQWIGQGANKDTPDDLIVTLYGMKVGESASNEIVGKKAVQVIAKTRNSSMLQSWLATGNVGEYQMSLDDACQYLGVKRMDLEGASFDSLEAVFTGARMDRPNEQTDKAIKTIKDALSGGSSAAAEGPHNLEDWPVGLQSHGNTCYLNSILQYYFSIKLLRNIVLDYENYKLNTPDMTKPGTRVGQREISAVEVRGGIKFAETLKEMFQHMITSPDAKTRPDDDLVCRTFLEPSDHELLKAEQQARRRLTSVSVAERPGSLTNGDADIIISEPIPEDAEMTEEPTNLPPSKSDASSVTLEGDGAEIANEEPSKGAAQAGVLPPTPPASPGKQDSSEAPPLPPRRRFSTLTTSALEKANNMARDQQDATEVHDKMMFRLRAGVEGRGKDADGEQQDVLRDIFSFNRHERTFKDGKAAEKAKEVRDYIDLNVPSGPTDIYSALEDVLDPQDAPNGNERHIDLETLPPLLQINISRNAYATENGVFKGTYKVTHPIKLEDEIYLDRFHDRSHAETAFRRRQRWTWRRRLKELRKQQATLANSPESVDMDTPSCSVESSKYLEHAVSVNATLDDLHVDRLDIDQALASQLAQDGQQLSTHLSAITTEIDDLQKRLSTSFDDLKQFKYRLHAVFIHRGNTGSGHYWIYIHDFDKDIWRQYNDETVSSESNLNKIFHASTAIDGTPTYAVYVRDQDKNDIVQPLCRKPEKKADEQWDPAAKANSNVTWGDVDMRNGESQAASGVSHIAPKTEIESGTQSWDTENREVGTSWNW